MNISSNIYANKIFSEHPLSIYPLDDDVSYLSLITNNQRLFSTGSWSSSANNSSVVSFNDLPTLPSVASPFDSDTYTSASISNIISDNTEITIESPALFSFNELNDEMSSFCIGMYMYQEYFYVNWYEFGYKYYDTYTSSDEEVISRIYASENSGWINFENTFVPPPLGGDNIRIFLRINLDAPISGIGEANFIFNGITVGQWSENTSSSSLGVIPSTSVIFGYDGVVATEYGIEEESGYYISENGKLLSANRGLPIVYGSDNSTKIYPSSSGNPSLIIPGNGFINDSGRYRDISVEFWMRVNPKTVESRRIFGPINSDNGVYVRDGVISLVIGNSFGSHPVSQWYRTMLVHIIINDSVANLFINGENVISINIDRSSLELQDSSYDWVGFYSYSDILNFEIDCVSFYSYPIPVEVAKRRLVWGQGTDSPQNIANSYSGTNAYINFTNAGYTHNKPYPDIGNWSAGYLDNIKSTRKSISTPEYQLPEIYIGGRSIDALYSDNKIVCEAEDDTFFTFRPHLSSGSFSPNGTKWTESGYIFFESLSIFDNMASIYGIYSAQSLDQTAKLMIIKNSVTNDVFEVVLDGEVIYYKFNSEVITSQTTTGNTYDGWGYSFAFGFNVKDIVNNFSSDKQFSLRLFFQSFENLQAYFGGDGSSTFEEKIYRIGFSNKKNYSEISQYFLADGTLNYSEYSNLINHFATYTLVPFIRFNRFFLDISVSSSWEEYFPLSSFGGYVNDLFGNKYYDLDMLQINIGYSSVTNTISQIIENTGWTYLELHNTYSSPVSKSYQILDNELITGYQDYDDLKNNNIVEYVTDTSNSSLRSFITFQLLSEGANEPIANFPYSKNIIECCYIDADAENTSLDPYRAYKTKFEFIDGAVVFPPKSIDFNNVAMTVYFDIKQDGILSNPLRVRDFEIASRALSQNEFNPIGTESGLKLYPYAKSGIYYDNKEKNPVRISKSRMPYLSLDDKTGIKVLGRQTADKEFGVAMPVNEERKSNFNIAALQLWMKFDARLFPSTTYPIFEIQGIDKTIEFVIYVDSSTQRGIIVPRDKQTKIIESGISFYKNGIRVNSLFVEKNEWNAIGINFDNPVSVSNSVGYINMFRGATFNNISYYPTYGLGETSSILARSWLRVLTEDDITNFDWQYWYDQNGSSEIKQWRDVYVISEETDYSLTPENIYKTFVGNNKFIVDDGSSITIDSDSLRLISDTSWTRFSGTPA